MLNQHSNQTFKHRNKAKSRTTLTKLRAQIKLQYVHRYHRQCCGEHLTLWHYKLKSPPSTSNCFYFHESLVFLPQPNTSIKTKITQLIQSIKQELNQAPYKLRVLTTFLNLNKQYLEELENTSTQTKITSIQSTGNGTSNPKSKWMKTIKMDGWKMSSV